MGGRYKETGAYAYEAFAAAMNYRNHQGGIMPQWDTLSEVDRYAWREAAHAAIRYGWHDAVPVHAPGTAGAWEIPVDPDTRISHRASDG